MAASFLLQSPARWSPVGGQHDGSGGVRRTAAAAAQGVGQSGASSSAFPLAFGTFGRPNIRFNVGNQQPLAFGWSWISSTGTKRSFENAVVKQSKKQQRPPLWTGRAGLWKAEVQSEAADVKDSSSKKRSPVRLNAAVGEGQIVAGAEDDNNGGLVGEDAAAFDVVEQKTSSWAYFTLVLGVVLAILYVIWLDPNTGYGGAFIDALTALSNGSHEAVMVELLLIFALVHSGGAGFRATGEKLIGERAYRVLFAGASLPLAVSAVVYFINHRYDGYQLWQFRTVPGVDELCWAISFVSFLFLYPSTFNLLEVAAVDKPKVHMWETGIMRITRHPQMVGQVLWCVAHTLWIGNSFTLITSLGLTAHHVFGVWHGDRRLSAKYGEAFEVVKKRTSVVPFAAIVEGRQELPPDYYKEFLRVPYYVIVGLTVGAYWSHPLLQSASHWLHW